MKIQQETHPYRPITLKLEKKSEAEAFFGIIDKLENLTGSGGTKITFNTMEASLIIQLSNAMTNQVFIL